MSNDMDVVRDLSEKLDRPSSNMDEVHLKELAGMAEVWDENECKVVVETLVRKCPGQIFLELCARHNELREAITDTKERLASI